MRRHDQPDKQRLLQTLREQGIRDERVLAAMDQVPRDRFVPRGMVEHAWENHALPIDYGQTISQPYVVAAMTAALQLDGSELVLEIGTGSGYQAAILSLLAREVISIERIDPLADRARALLVSLDYENVTVIAADGSQGWPERAPYDGIIVTAGAPAAPPSLLAQLSPQGGRLVLPVGQERAQELVAIERNGEAFTETSIGPVAFVPLIGAEGWPTGGDARNARL
jgi:protein-L-isoaspartate(D-aspartate) O-methyltransferase